MKKLFGYIIALSLPMVGQQQQSPTINQTPTRQFGHPSLSLPQTQASPNLVEGRELNAPGQIAFDNSVTPPILYVADIGNNRVLAFKTAKLASPGQFADLVIGQQDLLSTIVQGPGTALTSGLNSPTGVAVDSKGNLYVADTGNNRILRFPSPFNQPAGSPPQPDLVIGQKGINTGVSPNEGGNPAAKTLALASGGTPYLTSLAIDATGNLWTTDPLNNRVLMYPVANLSPGTTEPVATVVLGQANFTTGTPPSNFTQLSKGVLSQPSSLAFDSAGNLYVSDSGARVLYFLGPNFATQGQAASRVLGISPPITAGQPATVYPTQYTLGFPNASGSLISPNGVFTLGNHLFVADTPAHRIVEYDIPSNWAPETTAFPSPASQFVFGQNGANSGQVNQGLGQPNQFTVASPFAGAFLGNQMWISDTGNNRVLAFSLNSVNTYSGASEVVGQLDYIYNAPNLIVGSEVFLSGSGSGIAIDQNSNPPHLYVSDPGNNRILCFADARKVGQAGGIAAAADFAIGQPDLKTSEVNYPSGLTLTPTATGLNLPVGLAVDNNGNLYVADSGNGRVVRFPAPFNHLGTQPTANLVLGQSSFTTVVQNAAANSMHSPYGVALFADVTGATPLAGSIAVSDPSYNRVLIFKKQAGGDFVSGQSAQIVIGQSSFSGFSSGAGFSAFNSPRGIASDVDDRLYVADSLNNRVLVFTQAPEGSSGPTSSTQIGGLSSPQAVAVNAVSTELWVANSGAGQIWRYPEYNTCALISCAVTAQLFDQSAVPLGIALDGNGNVIVGDASNRVLFYFAAAFYRNAANFNTQPMAPGMLAVLGRLGKAMSIQDGAVSSAQWPTTLSDLNVTVNGTPAPIFATNSGYGAVYMQVPSNAPTSGTATFMVTQASTGLVLSVGNFPMTKDNPGFFTVNQAGTGPVIAQNAADGTLNSAANPVARGANITFCLTGMGQAAGSPPDGQPPVGAPAAPTKPELMVIGTVQLTPDQILYSGLGCGFAGGWQINATVPITVAPGQAVVALVYNGVKSNIGGTNTPDGITPGPDQNLTGANSTTIFVKQ